MLIKLKCEHCNKPINRADRCIKHTDTLEIFCSVDCAQEDNKKYLKEEAAEANDLIAMIEEADEDEDEEEEEEEEEKRRIAIYGDSLL